MEDDFYCTIKLISGEEIFAKVSVLDEDDRDLVLLLSPIVLTEVQTKRGYGYKVESWLKTTSDDMFILDTKNILTMTESFDKDMILMYNRYLREKKLAMSDDITDLNYTPLTKEMGYVTNINEAKKLLEKLFKQS
jgi:hypothetical protein